jgi:carboxyl-terminal processing protease
LKDTTGRLEVLDDPEPGVEYDGPLAVLINRTSASASEIFAGAIQDYHRGVVLGQRSFGKGTVQNLVPLDRWQQRPVNGQLTVTIGKFYRVTGESTQHRGVEPDVQLPSDIDMKTVGESALEAALPWDRIPGVAFRTAVRNDDTSISSLDTEEKLRAEKDPDYRWLVQTIASIDQQRELKTISLNLNTRKEERAQQDAQRLARENSRRAAKGQPALKTTEELEKEKPEDLDIVLAQAAEIMGDMVTGVRPASGREPQTVKADVKPKAETTPN